ncbi:hypothetical protein ANO14919_004310 [Xylariales sp. No.14919]|nr:hypothetical protein F5X98DRAFT_160026 [Xylaria grammica]GAW11092.1 hypothetical protein ANO14919_004310 [Xylariales sp. No.14919]
MHASVVLSALLSLLTANVAAKAKPKNAILLSEVQSLTLRANKQTSHRRVSAIPQLRCVSSRQVCDLHTVDVMRCTNQGSSYGTEDIEWSCTASLPPELKLGATDVICEGHAGPDDPYVLRGSCGVEYRLILTDLGEQKFPKIANAGSGGWFSGWGSDGGSEPLPGPERDGEGPYLGAWLFGILFVGVLLWIVFSAWRQANGTGRRPRNGWFGDGGGGGFDPGFGPGGGGGDGHDSPPPPYSKYYGSSRQGREGWRPGFWSGVAGGAAAGYLAGNRGAGGGSGWDSRPRPSSRSRGSDSGAGSTSSSRYTSTGFGSTSRR